MRRRALLAALPLLPAPAFAQGPPLLEVFTAQGATSPFVMFGEGLARFLSGHGVPTEARPSTGSLQNLSAVEDSPAAMGMAFLGSVPDALNGTQAAGGRRHVRLRALFPTYETSFQGAALAASGLREFGQLDGRRVGAGPPGGPMEVFLRAAADAAGIRVEVVNGDAGAMTAMLLSGQVDALWQGAIVPIPTIVNAARQAPVVVFGPGPAVMERIIQRVPVLAPTSLPPGTYVGQDAPLQSFAAWNVVAANQDMPDELAHRITRLVMEAADPAQAIAPVAAATRRENARHNRILPYHPGAARWFREAGVPLPG